MFKIKTVTNRKVYAFRQWSRKPYAVFNSLKLLIKISVLSTAYTLLNPVQECKAQSDSTQQPRKMELDEVEVSGQRAPVVYSQIARVVSVISRTDIEQAPAQSINELLENVPQVDVRQRGSNGVQADISIQGGSFDQTLILLNGINLTDPQTGHHNLNLPIDIESIDRIEVLKGPASRVFGTNAFSGAVNFVTGENSINYVKSSISGGSFGLYRIAEAVNYQGKKFNHFINASKSASDGYQHNTDFDITNAFYHGKFKTKQSDLALQLGYSQKKFGANSFYTPAYADQFETTETYFATLGTSIGSKFKITPNAFWRRNFDHYILIRNNPSIYQNFHFSDLYGGNINTTFSSNLGYTSIGAEYRYEQIFSTRLGITTKDSIKVPGENIYYNKTDSRDNLNLTLGHDFYLDELTISAGFMVNRNSYLEKIEIYPGIDLGYRITENIKSYASINRSLRLPNYTDLYYNGPNNIGNPDLKPETAWTGEAGMKLQQKGIQAHFSIFHRLGNEVIDWVRAVDTIKWQPQNFTELNTTGGEISISVKPGEYFDFLKFIRSSEIMYSYSTISKSSGNLQSNYALDNLKHKLCFTMNHTIFKYIGGTWVLNAQDRNGNYGKWDNVTKTSTETPYPAFLILDGKIYFQKGSYQVYISCSNIFNTSYIDLGNITQPGRWFRVGFDVSINNF
jgi:iron complex outermembrane receptor protein